MKRLTLSVLFSISLSTTALAGVTFDWYANVEIMPVLNATAYGALP